MIPSQSQDKSELIQDFMKIVECGDYQKASKYMSRANYQIDSAVQLYFDQEALRKQQIDQEKIPNQIPPDPQIQYEDENQYVPNNLFNGLLLQQLQALSSAELIRRYKHHLEEKNNEPGESFIKIVQDKVFTIFGKKESPGEQFISHLSRQKILIPLKFNTGDFEQNLKESQTNRAPLLLYVHSDLSQYYLTPIWENETLMTLINKNYRILGLKEDSKEIGMLKLQFQILKSPCFLIIRRNIFDKIIPMGYFNLTPKSRVDQLILQMDIIKTQYQKIYLYENYIKETATNNNNNVQDIPDEILMQFNLPSNFDQQISNRQLQRMSIDSELKMRNSLQTNILNKPKQVVRQEVESIDSNVVPVLQNIIVQPDKYMEEKILRREQDEAFRIAEEKSKQDIRQKKEAKQIEKLQQEARDKEKEDKKLQRSIKLSKLSPEPKQDDEKIMNIQFRMPNSQIILRRFFTNTLIKELFDFVTVQEEHFFDNPQSQIDLIQNFPILSLLNKQDESLLEVFGDSVQEQLIVKEND